MQPWNFFHNQRTKILAIVLGMMIAVFLFLLIDKASAQNEDTFGLQPIGSSIILGGQDIRIIIGKIVRAVLGLLGVIVTVIILYAGYLIMTSAGNEEKITKGKRTLTNAVIGLAIILSALAITQFILNSLSKAVAPGKASGPQGPEWDSFMGSGGLGRVVKEHYPLRDQKDAPRNTKISVTFMEAVNPASVIDNTNKTCWPKSGDNKPIAMGAEGVDCLKDKDDKIVEYFGDCILGDNFSWETSCDHLKIGAVSIYNSTSTKYTGLSPEKDFVKAAAMAVYEKVKEPVGQEGLNEYNAFTFVFKPFVYLDSESENMPYTARLTSKINKKPQNASDEPVSVFDRQYVPYYYWEFETGTYLDVTPPTVEAVRPRSGTTVPKNNIVQVYFSEAMDPTVTQGYLSHDSISHLFFNTMATGIWKLANGYKVAEFVSDLECGVNSCGEKMYCLPTACADPKDKNCKQNYEAMARAGELFNKDGSTFEAVSFSGIMDMAGNALDGNNNHVAENRPNSAASFAEQRKPDNYYWTFIVLNNVDRAAPVVEWINPAIDAEGIKGKEPLKIRFSKVMWLSTLPKNIFLEEYPPAKDADSAVEDELGFYLESNLKTNDGDVDKTELVLKTAREFGPYHTDLYYFPKILSQVKTETQNCFYPGRGPWGADGAAPAKGTAPVCVYEENENGEVLNDKNCMPVNLGSGTDTGCAQTSFAIPKEGTILQPNVLKCVEFIKTKSPSKYIKK